MPYLVSRNGAAVESEIAAVRSWGSIVELVLADGTPVYWDANQFKAFYEDFGDQIIGLRVIYRDEDGIKTLEVIE